MLHRPLLVLAEGQDGVGALADGGVHIVLGMAHHRTTHQDLEGVLLYAAAGVQQLADGGADGTLQVLGLIDAGAGYRNHTVGHRHAGIHRPVNGGGGDSIEYRAADGGRQSAGRHLPAGNGLAQLLFSALGVPGVEHIHHHRGLGLLDLQPQQLRRVLLVGLHADMYPVHTKSPGQDRRSADDFLRILQQEAVVAGDIWLTLRGIDDNGIHLAKAGADLYMGGEGSAAHTHDTCVLYDLHQLLRCDLAGLFHRRMDVRAYGVVEVIFNDYAHHRNAAEMDSGLHRYHLAGYTGMDGCRNESHRLPYPLSYGHHISHGHTWLAGGADMHGHRDHDTGRGRQLFNGLLIGGGFLVIGMNAAKEGLCHILTSFFKVGRKGP